MGKMTKNDGRNHAIMRRHASNNAVLIQLTICNYSKRRVSHDRMICFAPFFNARKKSGF